jgi:hypothetical protein
VSDTPDNTAEATAGTFEPSLAAAHAAQLAGLLTTIAGAIQQLHREPLDLKAKRHLRRAEQATRQALALVSAPAAERTEPEVSDGLSVAIADDP